MAHTSAFSSMRKTAHQPLICTKITKLMISKIQTVQTTKNKCLCSYIIVIYYISLTKLLRATQPNLFLFRVYMYLYYDLFMCCSFIHSFMAF